eukprot:2523335-Amphidinium_carterae.1
MKILCTPAVTALALALSNWGRCMCGVNAHGTGACKCINACEDTKTTGSGTVQTANATKSTPSEMLS